MTNPEAPSNTPGREASHASPSTGAAPAFNPGWLLGLGFVVLACVFWFSSGGDPTPGAPTPAFDVALLDAGQRTTLLTDPPTVLIAGFEQRCNACHKLFESDSDGTRPLTQHGHIELAHGLNDRCSNCHDRDDRERLVLHDGSSVPYAETATLCAQCHGPVYRDWQRGTHGKTLGAWDLTSADAQRLSCTECHDAHSPAFPALHPLPGPNTLRMGEPSWGGGHHGARNPLRRWADHAHDGAHEREHEHGDDDGGEH